jgi:ABC-type multidrug transport system ATPase subunit
MDPHGITAFKKYARDAADRGKCVIYSTQILDVVERFSDRVCVIQYGELRAFDSVANLRAKFTGTGGVLENLFQQLREETTL